MQPDYIKMLTSILTKQGAFGELKMKLRELATAKPPVPKPDSVKSP